MNSESVDQLALENARAVFQTVVNFRAWNASHGGVFVYEDEKTKPNPYLPEHMRSLQTLQNKRLIMVNPAYMTRKVGEISSQQEGAAIRITSLQPLRSENTPSDWEHRALLVFQKRQGKEYGQYSATDVRHQQRFQYASELIVTSDCLVCHAQQGYKVGDIRGAVSVSLPAQRFLTAKASNFRYIVIFGLLIWALGLTVIILWFARARAGQRLLERLAELSLRDPLTGIHNRRGFEVRAEQALRILSREKGSAVLAFADLDDLKTLNDDYGHREGDAALACIGQALDTTFRESDIVGRIGGDEFAVLLLDALGNFQHVLQQRIDDTLEQVNARWSNPVSLALSVGFVSLDFSSTSTIPDISQLLSLADKRMYQKKRSKKRNLQIAR